MLVTAIEVQCFQIEGLGQFQTSSILVDITDVADGVSQLERIAFCAVDGDGFLVVLKRGIQMMQVSLNLSQTGQGLGQVRRRTRAASQRDRLGEVEFSVSQTKFESRLRCLLQEMSERVRHSCGQVTRRMGRRQGFPNRNPVPASLVSGPGLGTRGGGFAQADQHFAAFARAGELRSGGAVGGDLQIAHAAENGKHFVRLTLGVVG